jgi:predicted outer membrane repeat protein
MKRIFYGIIVSLFSILMYGQTSIGGGNVSGLWSLSGSPYNINGDITIISGETLVIEPGVRVNFTGSFTFAVQGRILASGTPADSIVFTCPDTSIGWKGLRFVNTPSTNDSSIFNYCRIEGGKNMVGTGDARYGAGIFIRGFSKVRISNCLFQYNRAGWGGGVSVRDYASIIIENSTFRWNNAQFSGSAIRGHDYSDMIIRNNLITENSGSGGPGIYLYRSNALVVNNRIVNNVSVGQGGAINLDNANPIVVNNLIANNSASSGGAIYATTLVNALFINNTIANNSATNGGAIYINLSSAPMFKNCIIWGNSASWGTQVFINNDNSDPNFQNSIIQHGTLNFYGPGSGGNYQGIYTNNLEVNPEFVNSGTEPFSLVQTSPAINRGTPDTSFLNLPLYDIAGNMRIYGDTIDIGAYEYQPEIPVELYSFTINRHGKTVKLEWFTATEINNKGFFVEKRRGEEGEWEELSFINGKGSSTEINYYFYEDIAAAAGKYFYRLKQIDFNGTYKYYYAADAADLTVDTYELMQNYPNPFNPSTKIGYHLPEATSIQLVLYDLTGRKIMTLAEGNKDAGYHTISLDGKNLSSGVYFYRLLYGTGVITKQLMILK